MKPLEQSISEGPEADCLRACIASILELPIETVPNYHQNWLYQHNQWLKALGLTLVNFDEGAGHPLRPRGFSIGSAKSPRGNVDHCVVCFNGAMVWDPHPKRDMGIGQWVDWIVFAVLDPAAEMTRRQASLGREFKEFNASRQQEQERKVYQNDKKRSTN